MGTNDVVRTGRTGPLVLTKIHRPRPRADLAPRPRLLQHLERDWEEPLTLIVAPAGYGKSSLLSVWADRQESWNVAWLSIDPQDNDPVRFFNYLLATLQEASVITGSTVADARVLEAEAPDHSVLPAILNSVVTSGTRCVVVLDDYHLIEEPTIHSSIAWLVDRAPRHFRIVLTSRSEPPLPVARWIANRQMKRIDEQDLRFSREEASTLFSRGFNLALPSDLVARLVTQTEGWSAALTMAGFSLSRSADHRSFVERFTGRDRSLVDYLASEVLASVPHELRSFLIETSILSRMCAPLCDAVTRRTDSATLLTDLEDKHLFVHGLDNERRWFRYHHLFAEWLTFELQKTEPGLAPTLHRRASDWHSDHGTAGEAIEHALAAHDHAHAVDLIAFHAAEYLERGLRNTLVTWMNDLPDAAFDKHPALFPVMAFSTMLGGIAQDASDWLNRGESALSRLDSESSESRILEVDIASVWPLVPLFHGQFTDAVTMAARAVDIRETLSDDEKAASAFDDALAEATWGLTLMASDDEDAAHDVLLDVVELRPGSGTAEILAGGLLGCILSERRDGPGALQRARDALAVADQAYDVDNMSVLPALLAVASAGEHEEANQARERVDAYLSRVDYPVLTAWSCSYLARHHLDEGDLEEARRRITAGDEATASLAEPGMIGRLLAEVENDLDRIAAGKAVSSGDKLSDRELTILKALAGPLTRREIGRELHLSHNTVKTYTQGAYRKLGVSSREEAVKKARQIGLIA